LRLSCAVRAAPEGARRSLAVEQGHQPLNGGLRWLKNCVLWEDADHLHHYQPAEPAAGQGDELRLAVGRIGLHRGI